ncbi:MAG: hypothetical protein U0228_13855 [Myxococcaceae bacterium]
MRQPLAPFLAIPALLISLLTGCNPPTPALGKLIAPTLTAQRRASGPLQVILTYDTGKTGGCGTVPNLRATLDGMGVAGSAGSYDPMAMNETDRCQFPGFLITPDTKTTPREIVFTDDVTTMTMVINTLNLGTAVADSPPATLHSAGTVRWLVSAPAEGTNSYKATFTPSGGAEAVWTEGAQLPSSLTVTIPTQTASASGDVALTWLVNTTVTKCEGLASCSAVVQGTASFKAVVSP